MALTYLTVTISNPRSRRRRFKRRFLVDSGAIFSVAPSSLLKKLKVKPIDKQEFILANGERIVKDIGQVQIELLNKKRIVPIVYGEDDIYLVGATTLEVFGLMLDPLKREVKPLPMVI